MDIFETVADFRIWRKQCTKIAYVPTMGALHAGHLALVEVARTSGLPVVASIFVNPMQFGVGEDLGNYPRPFEQDKSLLKDAGVEALFHPSVEEMYPVDDATTVTVTGFETLCGAIRPSHFDGVATVISKLFNIVQPTNAYFGEKDYQQLQLIKRLVTDLHMDVDVIGVPTVREADGLALSSRNQYLSDEERQQAAVLPKTLQHVGASVSAGEEIVSTIDNAKKVLLADGFQEIDYLEIVDGNLQRVTSQPVPADARVVVAAKIGTTRLIDNMAIN